MKIILLLFALSLPFEILSAAENPAPESILDGLPEEVLSGLDSVVLDGEYILEVFLIPLSSDSAIYNKIEISEGDQRNIVRRNKKRRAIRDSEPEDLLLKTGFE